jgi:hypothetical protein
MRSKQTSPTTPQPIETDGELPWTMDLPEFGKRFYGLTRARTYAAAARGDLPIIRLGGRIKGLPRVAARQLAGKPD